MPNNKRRVFDKEIGGGLATLIGCSPLLRFVKINHFTYFYPEKPLLINKDQNLFTTISKDDKWIAEFKYNGSRLQLHNFDGKFEFWNRHNVPMSFHPTSEIMDDLVGLNLPKGYNLFDGELRHNKVIGVQNKIVLYDVLIWDGEVLLNTPFGERRKILESLLPIENTPIGITRQFPDNFNYAYECAMKDNEFEGLVMKNLTGKLDISRTSNRSSQWMLKVRKASGSYKF